METEAYSKHCQTSKTEPFVKASWRLDRVLNAPLIIMGSAFTYQIARNLIYNGGM